MSWSEPGVKDCEVGEERKKGTALGDRQWSIRARHSPFIWRAFLWSRWEGWETLGVTSIPTIPTIPKSGHLNKVLRRLTGQSGPVSLRQSLIGLALFHLVMAGERISVVATSLTLRFSKAADAADILVNTGPTCFFCENKPKKNNLEGFGARP